MKPKQQSTLASSSEDGVELEIQAISPYRPCLNAKISLSSSMPMNQSQISPPKNLVIIQINSNSQQEIFNEFKIIHKIWNQNTKGQYISKQPFKSMQPQLQFNTSNNNSKCYYQKHFWCSTTEKNLIITYNWIKQCHNFLS